MQFDDFIHHVQDQAKLGTRDEAISITKAVLETLGERLDRKVKNGVAAQLPGGLRDLFLAEDNKTDRFDLAEFYNRVGARADLAYEAAVTRTWQVFSVLQQAIAEGEMQDILEDLPDEYKELVG